MLGSTAKQNLAPRVQELHTRMIRESQLYKARVGAAATRSDDIGSYQDSWFLH